MARARTRTRVVVLGPVERVARHHQPERGVAQARSGTMAVVGWNEEERQQILANRDVRKQTKLLVWGGRSWLQRKFRGQTVRRKREQKSEMMGARHAIGNVEGRIACICRQWCEWRDETVRVSKSQAGIRSDLPVTAVQHPNERGVSSLRCSKATGRTSRDGKRTKSQHNRV